MPYIRPNLKGKADPEVVRAFKDVHDRLDVLDKFRSDTTQANYLTPEQGSASFGAEATRSAIKATGSTPLNLQNLQGIPAQLWNLKSFANNAAALAGGLSVGQFYRNGDSVYVVHS